MAADVAHNLRQQTVAARRLIESLREMGEADDAELVADTVEGETQLHEAVGLVMDEITPAITSYRWQTAGLMWRAISRSSAGTATA